MTKNTKDEKLININILTISMSSFSAPDLTVSIYNMQGNPLKREAVISIKLNRIGGLLTKILPLPTNEQESILCI